MTDRELLELAAKAAGIVFTEIDSHGVWFDAPNKELGKCGVTFNPLVDDGDALRLAVKLKMDVDQGQIGTRGGTPAAVVHYRRMLKSGQLVWNSCTEPSNDNPLAATRRAIVLAAAELGKNL